MKARGLKPVTGYPLIPRRPSGSLQLDRLLGGGIPEGMIINFWGHPSSGKSTMAQVVSGALTRGFVDHVTGEIRPGEVAFVDFEGSYSVAWGEQLGIDHSHLTLFQPETGEEALDMVKSMLQETYKDDRGRDRGVFDLIVFDSIGSLVFAEEVKAGAADYQVGLMPRKVSPWIRSVNSLCRQTGTTLLTLNHVTYKIGQLFGNPETQPGGQKVLHAMAIAVYFNSPHRIPKDTDKDLEAYIFRMRATKNKTAPPFRRADVRVRFDDFAGVDLSPELADLSRFYGIVTNKDGEPHKNGHIYYRGERLSYAANGGEKPVASLDHLSARLDQDPDLRLEFERLVRAAIDDEVMAANRVPDLEELSSEVLEAAPDHLEEEEFYAAITGGTSDDDVGEDAPWPSE